MYEPKDSYVRYRRIEDHLNEHQKKVRQMFRKALKSNLYVSINMIRDDIRTLYDNKETLESVVLAKLNIVTDDMIEYDNKLLDSEGEDTPDYKPYFYSFNIYKNSSLTPENLEFLLEMNENNKWYNAYFIYENEEIFDGTNVFRGMTEQCASPMVFKGATLAVSDEADDSEIINLLEKIEQRLVCSSIHDVKIFLSKMFGLVNFNKADIFRVGNANLINLVGTKGNGSFNMMYDIGFARNRGTKIYDSARRGIEKIEPNAVVLSHWDDDHIIGCVYANDKAFECPWIVPKIEKKNAIGAYRLAYYLKLHGTIIIIDRQPYEQNIGKFGQISFYMGQNRQIDRITKENCGGIVLDIKNKKRSIFCGDVPYKALLSTVWGNFSNIYDNVVVPHHGSKMNLDIKTSVYPKSGKAVICACDDKDTNRPNSDHKAHLKDTLHYDVLITEHAMGNRISIDL